MPRGLLLSVLIFLATMMSSLVVARDAMPSQQLALTAGSVPALSDFDCADELRAEQTIGHCYSEAAPAILPALLPFWMSRTVLVPPLLTVRSGVAGDAEKRPPKRAA